MEHNRVAWLLIRFSVQFRMQVPHTATFIHLIHEGRLESHSALQTDRTYVYYSVPDS